MPHIAYAPVNYYPSHLPYYEQTHPTTMTSASNMAATSTYNYLQNLSGGNHLQDEFFAWNTYAFNKEEERRGDEGRGDKGSDFQ